MPPNRYRQRRGPRPQRKRTGPRPGGVLTETAPVRPAGPVELPNPVVVKDFAEILGVSIAEIINVLIKNGIFATVNQSIDFDTASLVAGELGFETTERGAAERADGRGGRRGRAGRARDGDGDERPHPAVGR